MSEDVITLKPGIEEDAQTRGLGVAATAAIDAELAEIHAMFARETDADLIQQNRAWTASHRQTDHIDQTLRMAEAARNDFKALVTVGVGGSDLSARVFHEALNPAYHNLRPKARGDAPEVYFTGDTFDPAKLDGLLAMLSEQKLLDKTLFNVISKSGRTGETIATLMTIREELTARGVRAWNRQTAATTGISDSSELYKLHQKASFYGDELLPIPEGVGGRFSAFSPVGLFFLAATASGDETPRERVESLLDGVAAADERFRLASNDPANLAYRLAKWLHLGEEQEGRNALVFYNYADNQRLGDWFVQLYTESIQERGAGMDVIAAKGPTSNHSLLNGVLNGPRNKAVLFIHWGDLGSERRIPTDTGISGDLAFFEGLKLSDAQTASYQGTVADLTAKGVPNMTISVPTRNARCLGELMRVLMDAVAIKGRLQGLHLNADGDLALSREDTYRQDGVEGYKVATRAVAAEFQRKLP